MAQQRRCARCGTVITGLVAGRLCPACLLRTGLAAAEPADEPVAAPLDSDDLTRSSAVNSTLPPAFGGYEFLEVIARGGMGIVYKARQVSLNRLVAVKMLPAGQFAQPESIGRFRAEAEAIAQLQHPHIVGIHEIGEHDGQPYFTMDYIVGRTLAQEISNFKFQISDFRRGAHWLKVVAEAVHYAHQHGIIHRDLKPSNVLIDEEDQPHITDFGLAKHLTSDSDLTVAGQVLGSPNYLPPEQASGKPAGVGSDVYSLGAILYHLLTGRPPFQAESLTTLLKEVADTEPVAPRLLNPGIPRDLETVCLKCLEKEVQRRYRTAQQLADELGRFLEDRPIEARPVGAAGKVVKWCQRQPVRAGLIGALVVVFAAGAAGVLWQWRQAHQNAVAETWQRQRAETNELLALREAYAGDMNLVQRSLEEGDLGRARELLNKYRRAEKADDRPQKARTDLCGWEWRYLWGLCRSDDHEILTQQAKPFGNLLLSPDGKTVAVRQENGDIDLWDLTTRRRTATLPNQCWRLAMAFTPDGKMIASGNVVSNQPVITLWEVATGARVRNLPHPSEIASLAFSPDGEWLAAFGLDPVVRFCRVSSGELVTTNLPASEAINPDGRIPLFSPDGAVLALGQMDGRIWLCRFATGERQEIPAPTEGNCVTALAFSRDGRRLASGYGYSDGIIRLWDVATGHPVGQLKGHRGWVSRLVFASDGQTLFSASNDQTIRVWDVIKCEQVGRFQGASRTGLALSPDGETLVSCAADGSVCLWPLHGRTRQPAHVVLSAHVGRFGAPFTSDSRRFITASLTNLVTVWDVATATPIETFPALGTNNMSVALSSNQCLLAVGGHDGTVKVWNRLERRLVKQFKPHEIPDVYQVGFLDNDRSLVSAAVIPHRKVEMFRWDTTSWAEVPFSPIDVRMCYGWAQSPDQRLLALSYANEPVKLWDYSSGRLVAPLQSALTGLSLTPTFSADGQCLAAAVGNVAEIWEVASRREFAVLKLHANSVISVAFTPDGKRLVTGAVTGMELQPALRIWDYTVRRELISLWNTSSFAGWVQFSPDGNTLLSISWAGVLELWRAPSWAEIEAEQKGESKKLKAERREKL